MLYLIKSFGRNGKSILKVGYTDDLNRRMSQYFYNNPCFELIAIREGDELLEDMIQVYLKFLGYQYQRNGKLNEWFIDDPKIYQIFHIHRKKLEETIWKKRDDILNLNRAGDLAIYKYLMPGRALRNTEYILAGNKVIKLKYSKIDVLYNKLTADKIIASYNHEIIDKFINEFTEDENFPRRLKLYCEFRDKYNDDEKIVKMLGELVSDNRFYTYYILFGTTGCKAKRFRDDLLKVVVADVTLSDELSKEVFKIFEPGKKYNKKEIKEKLKEIYNKLLLSKTAKATDIEEWFEVRDVNYMENGKKVHGFEIIALKKLKKKEKGKEILVSQYLSFFLFYSKLYRSSTFLLPFFFRFHTIYPSGVGVKYIPPMNNTFFLISSSLSLNTTFPCVQEESTKFLTPKPISSFPNLPK